MPLRAPLAYNGIAMGFYDRDYQRGNYYDDRQPGLHLGGPPRMTTNVVIVTCIAYLAQLLSHNWLTEAWILYKSWYREPWEAYRLLTYGFLHSPQDVWHILLNMFALWLFGRDVENRYGRREFLAFYLVAIVVAGLVWTIAEIPNPMPSYVFGASGGIAAVVILFAMNYPHRTILLMFFIPMPMWVAAVIMVVMDAFAQSTALAARSPAPPISAAPCSAFSTTNGAGTSSGLLPGDSFWKRLKPKPKLRVHDPESAQETEKAVDDILKKIQDHGRDSLTRRERRILEEASREYQKKRR